MIRLNILCAILRCLNYLIDLFFPRSLLGEWFGWFSGDVTLLRRVIRELKIAQSAEKTLLESTLFRSAYDLGYMRCYGQLNQRILHSWLTQAVNTGISLNPELWKQAWNSGYSDAYESSLAAGYQLA